MSENRVYGDNRNTVSPAEFFLPLRKFINDGDGRLVHPYDPAIEDRDGVCDVVSDLNALTNVPARTNAPVGEGDESRRLQFVFLTYVMVNMYLEK